MRTVHLRTADLGSVRVREPFRPQLDNKKAQLVDKISGRPQWAGSVMLPGGVYSDRDGIERIHPIEARIKFSGAEKDVPELGRFVRFAGKTTITASFFQSGFGIGANTSTGFTITAERYETTDDRPAAFGRWLPVAFPPADGPPEILSESVDDRGRRTLSVMVGPGIVEGGAEVEFAETVEGLIFEPVHIELVAKLVQPPSGDETRRDRAKLWLLATSITPVNGHAAPSGKASRPVPAPQPAAAGAEG